MAKGSWLCDLAEMGLELHLHAFLALQFLPSVALDTLESMFPASDSLRDDAKVG